MNDLVDPKGFKAAMRAWARGVTVLTSHANDEVHGMTVSAFSSVSAAPPLVLVCANSTSTTHSVIQAGGVFAVNILASDQERLSNQFAFAEAVDRFTDVTWQAGETGAPLLDGCAAQLECRVRSAHLEGTHSIYIGEVLNTFVTEKEPLLYFDGGYRSLAPAKPKLPAK